MANSRLPTEILAKIVDEIDDTKTLLALSFISHAWHQVVQSVLYRSIKLWNVNRVRPQLQLLLRTLENKPQLANFVRELKVRGFSQSATTASRISREVYAEISSFASQCPNLARLTLRSCMQMGDQDLLGIVEKCTSLEELSIAGCCMISSKGLSMILPFLKNVRKLDLAEVLNLGDDGLCDIPKMCPLLEDLDLWRTRATPPGVSSIMKLSPKLVSLNLSKQCGINRLEMRALKNEKPSHLTITVHDLHDDHWDSYSFDLESYYNESWEFQDFGRWDDHEWHTSDYDYSDDERDEELE
ncbi:hypothetical protein DFS34DRAFT_242653 [Phlyctochytrium arcticum]|nr:hypothetical protein DFS34DRAFT_242653 [Phlyctochytrium arcticum]